MSKSAKPSAIGKGPIRRIVYPAILVVLALGATAAYSSSFVALSLRQFVFGLASLSAPAEAQSAQNARNVVFPSSADPATAPAPLTGGDLMTARSGHTATQLDSGGVLIVGGESTGASEIYDPVANVSVTTGNLNTARSGHTATKLSDGRVLIAGGGNSGSSALASTEVYDPSTGTFSFGPAMTAARSGHTATTLANGSILITGGGSDTAELFDGTSFSAVSATMTSSRTNHSAALMADGRVFIAGGDVSNTAEVFNPADSTFTAAGNAMTLARSHALLRVLPDGKVQIIGGAADGSMEVYDPAIDTIGAYAHVLPDTDTCANLVNYIMQAPTRAALIHNGQTDPVRDRSGYSVTELSGNKAIVIGGTDSNGNALSTVAVLNSSSATITTDKLDYAPGETVNVTGTGYAPGETVRVMIHEDPHTPQERGFDAVADANGNFSGTYLVQDYDLNMKFVAGARGLTSGVTAQTTFTDATSINSVTVIGSQTPNPVTAGSSATYGSSAATSVDVQFAGNGSCTATLSVSSGLPSGASATFSPASLSATTTSHQFSLLTVSTTAATPAGTYTITVLATASGGCSTNKSDIATFVVAGKLNQTITFGALGNRTYGDADFGVSATASSGLTVSFSSTTLSVCTVSGTTVHIVAAGTCTIRASQAGDSSYNAAPNVDQSFTVNPKTLTATIIGNPTKPYDGNTNATLTPTNFSLSGLIGSESFTVTKTAGSYNNANVASAATVSTSLVAGDFTPGVGTSASNYNLPTTASGAGQITAVTLTASIIGNPTKTYDGNANATLTPANFSLATLVGSDNFTVTKTTGSYNDVNVAGATTVSTTLVAGDFTPVGGTLASNYNLPTTASGPGHITQAASTTVIDCSPGSFTYTGSAITPCTATVTRVGDPNTTATVTYANNTNVGTATANASYAGDANHTSSTATQVTFAITQAGSSTSIDCSPGSFTYTGSAITPCTATVTRVGDPNTTTGVIYANNVNVGTATANASYAGDANHTGSTATQVTFAITQAGSSTSINCSPGSFTYTGSAITPCTATVTIVGDPNTTATVIYANNTNAGTATANASYPGDANHTGSTATQVSFTINKADQLISVTAVAPSSATYGQTFYVAATGGGSGNPVVIATSVACSGGGNGSAIITMTSGTGTCTVTYDQAGNANYNAAPQVGNNVTAGNADTTTTVNVTGIPSTGAWQTKAAMPTPRVGSAISVVGGLIYVAGGYNGGHITTVQVYDPVLNTWTNKADRPTVQTTGASGTIDSTMYVAGGTDSSVEINDLWAYTPATDSWVAKAPLPSVRQGAAGGVIDNLFYVAGGRQLSTGITSLQVYDPVSNAWTARTSMGTGRADTAGTVLGGKFYVFGGTDAGSTFFSSAEVYDPTTNAWTPLPAMPTPRGYHSVAAVGTRIYVTGGFTTGSVRVASVDVYDTVSGTWTTAPALSDARANTVAVTVGQTIYEIGGTLDSAATGTGRNESYTPESSSIYGDSVTFTANVAVNTPGAGIPTGNVQFFEGVNPIGAPQTLSGGGASVVTSSLSAGVHNITVQYVGDTNFNGSTSGILPHTVNPADQAITVTTPAPSSAIFGQFFDVAATGGGSGNDVVITTSGGCSGGGNGSATITMTSGTTTCVVHYNQAGNSNYNDAPEVTSSTTAVKATTSITVDPASGTYGGQVTLTATLLRTDAPAGALSGKTVNFTLNGNNVGSNVTNVSGVASVTVYLTSDGTLSGTRINAGSYPTGAGASFTADSDYSGSTDTDSLTVNQKSVTPSVTASNKTYDGNNVASIATCTVAVVEAGDDAACSAAGPNTFDNKNVGTAKPVSATGISLTGTTGPNYVLSSTSAATTADILTKGVTATLTAANKEYDGNTIEPDANMSCIFVGVFMPDVVTCTPTAGSFNDKDVLNANQVTATVTLGGAGAGNYTLGPDGTSVTSTGATDTTVSITPRTLMASITNNPTKSYDGNTTATLSPSNFSLVTLVSGEGFTVAQTAGTYNNANVTFATTVTAALAPGHFTPNNVATIVTNYTLPTTASGPGTIIKANAVVVVTPYNVTYDGNPHTATVTSITGVNGETGATVGSVDVSNTTHTNAGTYSTDSWSFTGTANYNNQGPTTITDQIDKANATFTVTPYSVTYNGLSHTATVSAITGVNGETGATVGSVDVSNTTHTNAGTYSIDSWSFTGTANYNNQGPTTITDQIDKANATFTLSPYTVTYDGNSHSATYTTITGVNGETGATVGSVDVSNTTHTNAGTYSTDSWSFTGTANYNNQGPTTITDQINKATPTVSVTGGTPIFNFAPHPATGFAYGVGGMSDVLSPAVTFVYVGLVPTSYGPTPTPPTFVGTYQVTASFAGNTNYTTASNTANITITTACSAFNGFLPPIGGSVETGNGGSFTSPVRTFKLKSTIPIKFSATCFGVPLTTGTQTLQVFKQSGSAASFDIPIDASPTDAATTGNQFRLTDTEWHFNLDTKTTPGMSEGIWVLRATLFDGSTYTVWISIKK